MPHVKTLTLLVTLLSAGSAMAQDIRLVSNPEMCAVPPQDAIEMGMELTTTGFSEIEYTCEFETQINFDWSSDQTLVRPGYCSEPGLISPQVFVVELPDYEPGTVFIWQQGSEEPARFTSCR